MVYNGDLTWTDIGRDAQNASRNLITSMREGERQYNEWQNFRASRTDAQIATALSRTEAEVAELDSCFAALLAIHNYANNQTPSQSDYYFSLRKFS